MKKILAALTLAVLAVSASAHEVTATTGRTFRTDTDIASVAVSHKFGDVRGEASVARSTEGATSVTAYGLSAGKPVLNLGKTVLSTKVGVNYLDAEVGRDGYGVLVGVEGAYPLTTNVSLVGELSHLRTGDTLRHLRGNVARVGVRYSF